MHLRVELPTPGGEPVVLDTREGVWDEPWGTPDEHFTGRSWVLPGLVDAHAHLARHSLDYQPGDPMGARERAIEALHAGVTLLFDKGWSDLTVVDLVDRLPPRKRPDIEAAGVILSVDGGYWAGFTREIDPGAVAPAVELACKEGRGWVKLIGDWPRKGLGPVANFTEAELGEAVRVAESAGSRVAIHTMAPDVPSAAVRAGVHSIEHGLFLVPDDLEVLGARGGSWVPTVLRVEAVIRQLGLGSSGGRLLSDGVQNVAQNLGIAVECGVYVQTGTDLAVGSDEVAQEAVRLWELGLGPEAVVAAVSGARVGEIGARFRLGETADAVIFDADPTVDPRVLSHPQRVIRMGEVIR